MTIDAKSVQLQRPSIVQSVMIWSACHIVMVARYQWLESLQPIRCISRAGAGVEINDSHKIGLDLPILWKD